MAMDDCNECHGDKWAVTPAHVWIDTEEHINAVACVDCHSWKGEVGEPPMLLSQKTLEKYCHDCHSTPENLAKKMAMDHYEQRAD
ncbi:hypothetical protein [Shewanella maritima]|uniref:hypothetical protein n=1 Tax=Shewanella maritima TaxID=2520507 RepID=UPI0037365324